MRKWELFGTIWSEIAPQGDFLWGEGGSYGWWKRADADLTLFITAGWRLMVQVCPMGLLTRDHSWLDPARLPQRVFRAHMRIDFTFAYISCSGR